MVRKNRLGALFACSATLFSLAALFVTSMGRADDVKDLKDLKDQKIKQQSTQVATEELVERIGTILAVMEYYQPDKAQQHKTLDRVANTLMGLSRTQMAEVLARLDKAAAEPDPVKSAKELQDAHARHLEIMQSLRALMAEYETLGSLDQIADKLDKLAVTELKLSLQSNKILKDQDDLLTIRGGFSGGFGPRAQMSPAQLINQRLSQHTVEQGNVKDELESTLQKANKIKAALPVEQKDLIEKLNSAVEATRVQATLHKADQKLDNIDNAFGDQSDRLREANTLQRQAAEDIKDLASVLRQGKDELAALRKAQEQLDESIRQQQELQDKAKEQAEKDVKDPPVKGLQLEFPDMPRGGKGFGGKKGGFGKGFTPLPVVDDRGAKELSERQAHLALDTRDTSNLLKEIDKEIANEIDSARTPMKTAEEALRERTPNKAVEPQDRALDTLKDARAKVADLIAKAEAKKNDPLAALQNAAETVEKLLQEQIKTRDQTKETGEAKEMDKLPQIAPQQKDLANRTDALNNKPLPTQKDTQKALDQAAKSMTNAAKNLQNQKADNAVAKQNDAIKSLEDAKKSLEKQIAEMEQRREDIAKLEDASQKLDKLTKNEAKVADQAKDKSQQPSASTKALAKEQSKLTPQAKDLAKELNKIVPPAADKVNQGAKNMDAAKKELDKNQAKPGSQEANKAVDRLKEAQSELAKKLDDLKAKELADQAALKKADPSAAMQQLQKAIEQARQAMKESQKAQNEAAQKSLAEQQKQLADQAKQQNFDKAAAPASEAAKALQRGDLAKALQQQKQALDKFQQGKEPGDKSKQGQGEPKQGQPSQKQLAERQQALMEATKQLAQQQGQKAGQAQQSNQGAMQALGQAMAGTPKGGQQQMQQAAGQLGQAGKQLGQGSPGQAAQSQQQAINNMQKAMQQMQGAQSAMAKQGQGKGQGEGKGKGQDQAKGQGQDKGQGQGKDGKGDAQAKGQGKGQDKGQGKGMAQEKNGNQGNGNRIADGKVNNTIPQLQDVTGTDTFLQLPPRQRELIRQALAGELPPEYAAQIQQYYLNISRGKSGVFPPSPK